jgi:hypothetical protein
LFVVQQELEGPESKTPGAIRASVLMRLPIDGGPSQVVADFVGDAPLTLGAGIASDADAVYWMNRSGRIFRLPVLR